jgi:phosphoribosylformylglycinamidine synthase
MPPGADPAGWLFGEDQGRYLLAVADPEAVLLRADEAGVPAAAIGRTGGDALTLNGNNAMSVAILKEMNERWLPAFMAGPAPATGG